MPDRQAKSEEINQTLSRIGEENGRVQQQIDELRAKVEDRGALNELARDRDELGCM